MSHRRVVSGVVAILIVLVGLGQGSALAAIQPWEEDALEREAKALLAEDRRDREAIGKMIDLCEARGDYAEAANWVMLLVKAGESQSMVESRLSEFQNKIAEDQDISVWENRVDYFRSHDQPAKALAEIAKLRERFTRKISRLTKIQKAFLAKQAAGGGDDETGNLDPNVDGVLKGYTFRLADLEEQAEELRGQLP